MVKGRRIFGVFQVSVDSITLLLFNLVVLTVPNCLSFFELSSRAQRGDKLIVTTRASALMLKADCF